MTHCNPVISLSHGFLSREYQIFKGIHRLLTWTSKQHVGFRLYPTYIKHFAGHNDGHGWDSGNSIIQYENRN